MSVRSDRNDLQDIVLSGGKSNIIKEIIWKYNNDYITYRVRMVKKNGKLQFVPERSQIYYQQWLLLFFFNFVYFFIEV